MYLTVLLSNQMIDNYLIAEKLRLCHRSIRNEISRRRRKRAREANLFDIIKIATIFIKTTFKNQKKVKRIRNYALKYNLYLYFLI